MSTENVNVIMHLPVSYKLTCIDKFMYMRAFPIKFVVVLNTTLCSLDVNIRVVRTTASDKGQERH